MEKGIESRLIFESTNKGGVMMFGIKVYQTLSYAHHEELIIGGCPIVCKDSYFSIIALRQETVKLNGDLYS